MASKVRRLLSVILQRGNLHKRISALEKLVTIVHLDERTAKKSDYGQFEEYMSLVSGSNIMSTLMHMTQLTRTTADMKHRAQKAALSLIYRLSQFDVDCEDFLQQDGMKVFESILLDTKSDTVNCGVSRSMIAKTLKSFLNCDLSESLGVKKAVRSKAYLNFVSELLTDKYIETVFVTIQLLQASTGPKKDMLTLFPNKLESHSKLHKSLGRCLYLHTITKPSQNTEKDNSRLLIISESIYIAGRIAMTKMGDVENRGKIFERFGKHGGFKALLLHLQGEEQQIWFAAVIALEIMRVCPNLVRELYLLDGATIIMDFFKNMKVDFESRLMAFSVLTFFPKSIGLENLRSFKQSGALALLIGHMDPKKYRYTEDLSQPCVHNNLLPLADKLIEVLRDLSVCIQALCSTSNGSKWCITEGAFENIMLFLEQMIDCKRKRQHIDPRNYHRIGHFLDAIIVLSNTLEQQHRYKLTNSRIYDILRNMVAIFVENQKLLQHLQSCFAALMMSGPTIVPICSFCGQREENETFKLCSACTSVRYCSREHQKLHWKEAHKRECETMKDKKSNKKTNIKAKDKATLANLNQRIVCAVHGDDCNCHQNE